MRRNQSWSIALCLALSLHCCHVTDCRMQGLRPYQQKSYMDSLSPDSQIDSFMKSHNLAYPQPSDSLYQHIKEEVDYYDMKEFPPSPHSYDYPSPNLHRPPSRILPAAHLTPQPERVEPHIKPSPQPLIHDEQSRVKVESRSSSGHAESNQRAAVMPAGVRESEREREEAMMRPPSSVADVYLLAVIAGCAVAAVSGLALTGLCWYRMHKRVKDASDVEYPAYGVTGPAKDKGGPAGDRKLAQSAQMYHYQHQKQQMIASERLEGGGGNGSEGESEEECEEGDYTVFECPGLATAGEMEVRNPLFNDHTPVATPAEK